jgi:serine/threonine protein kinase
MLFQANIFIDDEYHARLGDFGLSIVGETTQGCMTETKTGSGTVRSMSPERLQQPRLRRASSDDVYAYGCLAYSVSFKVILFARHI